MQDLTLSLLAKGDQYDASRGASVDTFADRVVTSSVKMILRSRRREKRAAGFFAKSLHSPGGDSKGPIALLVDLITGNDLLRRCVSAPSDAVAAVDRHDAVERAVAALTPTEADVARRVQQQSVNAIHKELGVSRRQIYAAVERIRRQFEGAGLGDGG